MKNISNIINFVTEIIFGLTAGIYMVSSFIEKDPTKSYQYITLAILAFICSKLMEITNKSDQA